MKEVVFGKLIGVFCKALRYQAIISVLDPHLVKDELCTMPSQKLVLRCWQQCLLISGLLFIAVHKNRNFPKNVKNRSKDIVNVDGDEKREIETGEMQCDPWSPPSIPAETKSLSQNFKPRQNHSREILCRLQFSLPLAGFHKRKWPVSFYEALPALRDP